MSDIVFKDVTIDSIVDKIGEFGETLECKLVHTFNEGLYLRELHIPKGALIVGHRHRYKTTNMLVKGKMVIYDGTESITVEAPFIAESEAFTRKVGYAIEDSVWVNVHATDETNIEKLEAKYTISEEEFKCLT